MLRLLSIDMNTMVYEQFAGNDFAPMDNLAMRHLYDWLFDLYVTFRFINEEKFADETWKHESIYIK